MERSSTCLIYSMQGRRENSRGPGENFLWGPYDVIFSKQ
jgi:hypothetical protein